MSYNWSFRTITINASECTDIVLSNQQFGQKAVELHNLIYLFTLSSRKYTWAIIASCFVFIFNELLY